MQALLITDLDNTLVGDDAATERLNQHLRMARERIGLVYATGRSYGSAYQLMQEKKLLAPDYWITGVGTAIYQQDQLDSAWVKVLDSDWQRHRIEAVVRSEFPRFHLQPEAEQNPWKLSFWLDHPTGDRLVEQLRLRLEQLQLKAQVIFSSNCDLDILPIAANKGNAVAYLRQRLGVAPDRTLVCGDSGNDISLFEQPVCGVIVKNAQPELMQWYLTYASSAHYLSRNPYAAGILEGLHRFQLLATA